MTNKPEFSAEELLQQLDAYGIENEIMRKAASLIREMQKSVTNCNQLKLEAAEKPTISTKVPDINIIKLGEYVFVPDDKLQPLTNEWSKFPPSDFSLYRDDIKIQSEDKLVEEIAKLIENQFELACSEPPTTVAPKEIARSIIATIHRHFSSSQTADAYYENFKNLPDDIKQKTSLHQLREIYKYMVAPLFVSEPDEEIHLESCECCQNSVKMEKRYDHLRGFPQDDEEFTHAIRPHMQKSSWIDIASAPKDEGISFLVYRPKHGKQYTWDAIIQVGNYEGRMFPDAKDACIDWEDGITNATHWMPLPKPPTSKGE